MATRTVGKFVKSDHEFHGFGILEWGFDTTYEVYNYDPKKHTRLRKKITEQYTKEIAQSAQKTIRGWLAPGGVYKIGWKGRAAAGLKVGVDTYNLSGASAFLYEDVDSLTAIRIGGKPGATPSINDIKRWISFRKIKARLPKQKWSRKKTVMYKGKLETKRKVTQSELQRRLPYAIQKSIYQKGTSEAYKQRFGQRYFDYIKKYVNERNYRVVQNKMKSASSDLDAYSSSAVASYLTAYMANRGGQATIRTVKESQV